MFKGWRRELLSGAAIGVLVWMISVFIFSGSINGDTPGFFMFLWALVDWSGILSVLLLNGLEGSGLSTGWSFILGLPGMILSYSLLGLIIGALRSRKTNPSPQ